MKTTPLHPPKTPVRKRRTPAQRPPVSSPAVDLLVPIDFSSASLATLEQARGLALGLGARITLLHVALPASFPTGMGELAGGIAEQIPLDTRRMTQDLDALLRRRLRPAMRGASLVAVGGAGPAIVAVARERSADLIVVATHGRTGFARTLMGSTAEYIIRHSHCPVFTIRVPLPAATPGRPDRRIRSIVVGVDLFARSREALRYAAAFAARFRARLTLVHVVPPIPGSRRRPVDASRLKVRAEQGARLQLEKLSHQFVSKATASTVQISAGDAAEGIMQAAAAARADLIVVGTHGRGALQRLLLGSTAENLMRHAPCPVLVVRRPAPVRGLFRSRLLFPVAPFLP